MEGPTPVSALIHAATMVAAGVYLVGRTFPIFAAYAESQSLQVVAWIGAVTAIMAASIGIAMNQAKRILAYSTISQLGYMMAGLGVGGVAVGIFHLMTHAFFKALLFLGAGSAMHGTHEHADLDIWKAGGLRTAMPITYWTFLAGTLALAGIVPFAGFWSKDGILAKAFENNRGIFIILLFGAFLTAFYMFRMIFVAFFGHPRVYGTPAHHDETSSHHDQDTHGHQSGPEHPVGIHESPAVMTVPLIILAVFSLVIGWVGIPFLGAPFERFVMGGTLGAELEAHPSDMTVEIILMALSTVVAVSGIGLAYILYGRQPVPSSAADPLRRLGPLYTVLEHKLYFDEIYGFLVVRPVLWLAHILASFDLGVVDELVNWTGRTTYLLSRINRWIDTFIVDGVVNGLGSVTAAGGRTLRYLQTGQIQNYILLVLMGITLLAAFYIYQFAR
jgi:NADH-quinone oxidoreductase subunit L